MINTDNNSDSEEVDVLGIVDLELTKSVDNASPFPLDQITWTITVSNKDSVNTKSDATGVVVEDIISSFSPDLVYFSHSITDAPNATTTGSFDPVSGVWTIGDIPNGEETTLEVTMDISETATGNFVNFAEVTEVDQLDIDSDPDDNTSSPDPDDPSDPSTKPVTTDNPTGSDLHDDEDNAEITLQTPPDLTLLKDTLPATVDPEIATWIADGLTEYSYTLTPALSGAQINNSSSTTPIKITDSLPQELTLVSASGTNWDCNASTTGNPGIVDCSYTSYPATPVSLTEPVTVVVTVNPGTDPSVNITNTATISSDEEPVINTDNNSDSEDTMIEGVTPPELTPLVGIAKTIGSVTPTPDPDNQGSVLSDSYDLPVTLIVKNYGLGQAMMVDVTDDLTNTFPDLDPSQISISTPVDIITSPESLVANPDYDGVTDTSLTIGANSTLDPGQLALITFTITLTNPTLDHTYLNTAVVTSTDTSDNTYTDDSQDGLDPDNNSDTPSNNNNSNPTDNTKPTPIIIPTNNPVLPVGDLAITKELTTPANGQAKVGDTVTYLLTITNNSDFDVAGPINITDILPTGLVYAGTFSSGSDDYTCSGTTTITCIKSQELLANSSEQLYLNVVVSNYTNNSLTNTAILSTQSITETTLANNSAVAGIQITKPDPTPTNPTPTTPTNQPNPSTPSKDINTNTLPSTGILSHPVTQLLLLISILSIPVLVARRTKSEK